MFGLGLGLGIHRHSNANPYAFPFISRVESDGGIIRDKAALFNLTNYLQSMMPNTKLLYCPELGVKLRTSGINNYVTKLYDVGTGMLDGDQTTALNQPYLSGNIAPNEKYAIKNPNGGSGYMTHTPISFSATDKWSISSCIEHYGSIRSGYYAWGGINTLFGISGASNTFIFKNESGSLVTTSLGTLRCLKSKILTLVSNGNGVLDVYLDSKYIAGIIVQTNVNLSKIYYASIDSAFNGKISYHCIRDIALTPIQVAEEYTYLRSLFPEIESVQIGTQNWATSNCEMTCTPRGNIIQEMQAATNVEKIVNGNFDTDTVWGKDPSWAISEGFAKVLTTSSVTIIYQNRPLVGKWIRCRVTIENYVSGSIKFRFGSFQYGSIISGDGSHTEYIYVTDAGLGNLVGLYALSSTNLDISSVSFEEVGWADSTNLYNYVYANTTGTAEQKEYAAVKAAAMWCYYNNDPSIGAVYGKLYNWYAVKLLQMDIDYYNAANPTTPWGWRVPTNDDFTTLSTYLGGDGVSGNKLKKEGSIYWRSPNAGADNSSGFSAISGGIRMTSGEFVNFSSWTTFMHSTNNVSKLLESSFGGVRTVSYYVSPSNAIGGYIRLIKA